MKLISNRPRTTLRVNLEILFQNFSTTLILLVKKLSATVKVEGSPCIDRDASAVVRKNILGRALCMGKLQE